MTDKRQVEDLSRLPDGRRRLTILFTDLSDSTRLSGQLEAEDYADMLDDLRQAFEEIVDGLGGLVNQVQGDGLQALFGYPHPSETDGRRAAEAALAVHDHVRQLALKYAAKGAASLSVHSGIHAGLMLARHGSRVAGRVELFGPAPGVAKHLSDEAVADEVLISEETLGPDQPFFATSSRRSMLLKGRESPLAVRQLLGRSGLRTRFEAHARRGFLPFLGRDSELMQLEAALEAVRHGFPVCVSLQAAAGVGKTRLAEEFLAWAAARGHCVQRGWCESNLSAEPLQPLLQMLRNQFRLPTGAQTAARLLDAALIQLDPELASCRKELLHALSIVPDAAQAALTDPPRPERTLLALVQVFAALSRSAPLLLFIDDWHWADSGTRLVVRSLLEREDLPLMILLANRPSDDSASAAEERQVIRLSPLDDIQSEAVIDALLPGADPFVTKAIRRHAGGNPLFLEELCHCVQGCGPRWSLAEEQGSSAWLETLIESRIARLPAEQSRVISVAAAVGNVVPLWLLQQLTGLDERQLQLPELAHQDLLFRVEAGDTVRFKHGITRKVVYGTLGLHLRQSLHARIASLIHDRLEPGAEVEACEALAYHHAGAANHADAARFAEMAGDKAMAASSIDRAKTQYRAALEMIDRLPKSRHHYQAWRSIVRRLGMACVFDPSRDTLPIFERAVHLASSYEDAPGLAYAQYWLAYVCYALGDAHAAVDHCHRALSIATQVDDARLAEQARATLGQALAAAADYPQALGLLEAASQTQRSRGTPSRPTPGAAYSLACKASVLGDLGRFEEARTCFDMALLALPGAGHEVEGSVLCWRSGVSLWRGDWAAARNDALGAERIAERVRSLYLLGMSRGLGAYANWKLGGGTASLQALRDAAQWLRTHDKNLFLSLLHGWLADALMDADQTVEARQHAAQALRRTRRRDWIGSAMASRAMARLAAIQGNAELASRRLAMADRVAELRNSDHERAQNTWCRAEVARRLGQRLLADMLSAQAFAAFKQLRMSLPDSLMAAVEASQSSHSQTPSI
jgi:class 3 adenylate cyclase/tetratricopeptide (TPR) repeat protein